MLSWDMQCQETMCQVLPSVDAYSAHWAALSQPHQTCIFHHGSPWMPENGVGPGLCSPPAELILLALDQVPSAPSAAKAPGFPKELIPRDSNQLPSGHSEYVWILPRCFSGRIHAHHSSRCAGPGRKCWFPSGHGESIWLHFQCSSVLSPASVSMLALTSGPPDPRPTSGVAFGHMVLAISPADWPCGHWYHDK